MFRLGKETTDLRSAELVSRRVCLDADSLAISALFNFFHPFLIVAVFYMAFHEEILTFSLRGSGICYFDQL